MKYIIDHDYHIHTYLSKCSNDEEENVDNIVKKARELGYKDICITDHLFDDSFKHEMSFYNGQNFSHISSDLPYKKYEGVNVYFGAECDLDKDGILGITKEELDRCDFLIIPVNHFHLTIDPFMVLSDEERAKKYLERINKVLDMDLPFKKIGLAHLTCSLIKRGDFRNHVKVYDLISDEEFKTIFKKTKEKGIGIEINIPLSRYLESEYDSILRVYRIAKEEGNKFYIGGDEHHIGDFDRKYKDSLKVIEMLGLTEDDKFRFL